jgi:tRNA-2-methylthio-N6-dimethylallyladenosine synthase
MIDQVGHAQAFSFKYSPRPGTPAATMADQVDPQEMDERLQRLQALINDQQHAFNRATLDARTRILIDRKGKLPGQMLGKSPWLQSVHVQTDAPIGTMVDVTIISAGPNSVGAVERISVAA